MSDIVSSFFNALFTIIIRAIDIILIPINTIIDNLFPSMANAITNFTNMCNSFFSGGFQWLLQFVPTLTKSMILIWITFEITYYGVIWTYTLVIRTYNVIQKIKFW